MKHHIKKECFIDHMNQNINHESAFMSRRCYNLIHKGGRRE